MRRLPCRLSLTKLYPIYRLLPYVGIVQAIERNFQKIETLVKSFSVFISIITTVFFFSRPRSSNHGKVRPGKFLVMYPILLPHGQLEDRKQRKPSGVGRWEECVFVFRWARSHVQQLVPYKPSILESRTESKLWSSIRRCSSATSIVSTAGEPMR